MRDIRPDGRNRKGGGKLPGNSKGKDQNKKTSVYLYSVVHILD